MSELERFVRSVLLGTFSKERFRTDVSSHLKKIEETSEEVFTGWKLLTYSKEILAVPLDQKEEQFSFADFFKEKLSDGHSEKNGVDRLHGDGPETVRHTPDPHGTHAAAVHE